MKVTERDKKLLLMLAYFVVIVGFGAFVFKPLLNHYMDLGDRIVLLEAQKEEMDARIAEAYGLEQRRNELAGLFRVATEDFYPMLESEEVDKEITGIVLSCGMQSLRMNIVMPEEGMTPVFYPYAEETAEVILPGDAAGDMAADGGLTGDAAYSGGAGTEDALADTEGGETAGGTYIYTPVVTLTAAGSAAQVEELIDKLTREYPGIRLRSYSRQKQSQGAEWAEEGIAGTELLSLELELYMCDRSVLEQGEKP